MRKKQKKISTRAAAIDNRRWEERQVSPPCTGTDIVTYPAKKNTHSGRARCRVFCPRIVCQPLWISGLPIFRWNGFCRFDFFGVPLPLFLMCSMPSYGHDISLLRDVRDGCMKHNPHVTFYLARPNPYLAPSDLP